MAGDRRLSALAILLLAGAAAFVLATRTTTEWEEVATFEQLESQGIVYAPDSNAFVVQHEGEIFGLAGWSPHTGRRERVLFCESNRMFVGEHGESFDIRGVYYGGPTPRGLDLVVVKLDDARVFVNSERVREGTPRGVTPLAPAGPFCPEDARETRPGFVDVPG